MSIDLSRNRDALMAAWKDVLDDKSSTDWALFGYEGQTNILKFVSKGSDGLEELIEDLNSGKVMYAFVKVHDPKTSLDKFVLINWQGEGANTLRKGMCANHLRDVEKFFSGAHLTINARNDEEVEPQLIVEKVAKAGSAYSFKTASKTNEDQENTAPTGPVGTAYQRVNPVKEINSKERDQFWRKEEQEEKKRLEEEKLRKQQERLRLEQELQRREQEECAKREAKSALRDDSIDQIKRAEILALEQLKLQNQASEENSYNSGGDVTKSSNATQSDLLRAQRKQEAQELIAQRTIDARSIFEKNTSVGQQLQLQQNNNNNVNSKKIIPEKPARNSIILKAQQQQQQQQHNQAPNADLAGFEQTSPQLLLPPPPSNFSDDQPQQHQSSGGEEEDDNVDDQFSTIKRSPRIGAGAAAAAAGAAEPSSPPTTAADHSAGAIAATSTDNRSDTIQDQSTTKTQRYEEKITVAMTIAQQQQQHNTADQSPSSVEHTLITDQQFVDEYLYGFSTPGLQARALYDYQAVDDSEITFDPGDIITNIDQVDEGWWQGLAPNGAYGLFPANYVELIQ